MQNQFKDIFKGKVIIAGVGNILRADDAFGPRLIEAIEKRVNAVCFDLGTAPENYIGKIAKQGPDTVLIVDAVDLGKNPGSFQLLRGKDIINSGFTTHDLSPRMFIDFLKSQTKAEIYLLGVQPQTTAFGEEMSEKMTEALEKIAVSIKEALGCTKPIL
ncbi:MAG: hydrogenase 3 maturation endopeptidase HyCI [Candidatus Omnitrophica bacterium]|nr:hydrogenase 3 maturation endopeptidase HyCI [Candidatus Omnitrophota bacterium]